MSYGTARRPQPDDHIHAIALLARGVSAQNVSRMTGVYAPALVPVAREVPSAAEAVAPPSFTPLTPSGHIHALLMDVAARHGVTVDDLKAASPKRVFAWARQEAMHELEQRFGLARCRIGRILGGRDHSTVTHGIREHRARMGGVDGDQA